MKTVVSLLLFFSTSIIALAQNNAATTITQELQKAVDEGLVVGIASGIVQNDTLTWTSAAGYSDRDANTAFGPNTISRTASITKPMTAIAIMQLVEQGKLELDKPMSHYLNQFDSPELKEITVRQVMQHSAGISDYKNKKEAANQKQYNSLSEAMQLFLNRDLRFTPGTDFYYTSYGYVTLGVLIEQVSGQTYEQFLTKNIFEPARMTNTSVEKFGSFPKSKSKVYHLVKAGKIKEITTNNLSDRIPGGGVQSTVNDLLKFGMAVLNNSLITKESRQELITNTGLKKEGNAYGMGWYLYGSHPKLGMIYGHNGRQYGCSSFMFLFPEKNMVSVVMTNTSGFNKDATIAITQTKVATQLKE